MASIKEGDRVRVISRPLTTQDRSVLNFYDHMIGLPGTVANVYGPEEVAVQVDISALPSIPAKVHQDATGRMRKKFADSVGEEQKKALTKEELEFVPNYVILVREKDLEKI
jgi:hypothetical protein